MIGVHRACTTRGPPHHQRFRLKNGPSAYYLAVKVEVNPTDEKKIAQIKAWVTQPPGPRAASASATRCSPRSSGCSSKTTSPPRTGRWISGRRRSRPNRRGITEPFRPGGIRSSKPEEVGGPRVRRGRNILEGETALPPRIAGSSSVPARPDPSVQPTADLHEWQRSRRGGWSSTPGLAEQRGG